MNSNFSKSVININGQFILSKALLDDNTTISVANLAAGLYFVHLKENGSIIETKKLLIK